MDEKYDENGELIHFELPSNYPDDIEVDVYIPGEEGEIKLDTELTTLEIELAQMVDPPCRCSGIPKRR